MFQSRIVRVKSAQVRALYFLPNDRVGFCVGGASRCAANLYCRGDPRPCGAGRGTRGAVRGHGGAVRGSRGAAARIVYRYVEVVLCGFLTSTSTADRVQGKSQRRIVWPVSGSRRADRGQWIADRLRRDVARGSINRRYLSWREFSGSDRDRSGPNRSSVHSFWL